MTPAILALVGMRCSGKTTVGRLLARALERELVDLDDALLAEANRDLADLRFESTGELLHESGVEAFRDLEERTLARVLATQRTLVLATGGGAVERPQNRALLRERTTCVWLTCDPATLQQRMRQSPLMRPALLGTDPIAEVPDLARQRNVWYREVATLELDSGALEPAQLTRRILDSLP